eukprot:gene8081-10948_t
MDADQDKKSEDEKKAPSPKDVPKYGNERLKFVIKSAFDKNVKKRPPIYEPQSYPVHILSALAYFIPICDAADLGKYMFEAYPGVLEWYTTFFGGLSSIYNGVPFLPFAIFFLMSYISRAPTFPVEVRFHFAQAFMISLIQFVPSLAFPLFEKAGVPGMAVLYNTVFLWVMFSSVSMQISLLNPIATARNPFVINVVRWAKRYMNYTKDMRPKA